jgi:hypothetical protein
MVREKRKWEGWAVRGTTFHRVKECRKFRALKVPRQCLFFLVKVDWREGKVLGSGRGKALGRTNRLVSSDTTLTAKKKRCATILLLRVHPLPQEHVY